MSVIFLEYFFDIRNSEIMNENEEGICVVKDLAAVVRPIPVKCSSKIF